MSKLKNSLILIFLTLFIFEFISFLFFKYNLLEISHLPKIYMPNSHIPNDEWWTEENEWGAWHKINSATSQKKSCFDVVYESNEIGARDKSFKINSENDIILIGDSFAEGYGVNYEHTSQKYLEDLINTNVLNFGVSKNFGPLQYYLIYNKLAKQFKHNKLIIYFLPDNDFIENDYNNWNGSKRYRPYYKKINENFYESFIPEDSVKNYLSTTKKIKKIFKDYFWISGLFINLNHHYKIYRAKKKYNSDFFSGYFDTSLDQQKATLFFIEKIINESNVNVLLVSIPRPQDFKKISNKSNLKDIYWNKFLVEKSITNNNFTFIDLIKYPPSNIDNIYLQCDGHWSPKGNLWAAQIISGYLNGNN